MLQKWILCACVLLCPPTLTQGAIIITAPDAILQPNLAGQFIEIKISATAGETANSADVFTKINGGVGGLPASAFSPPEAPAVTFINLFTISGMMFNSTPFGVAQISYPTPNRVSPNDNGLLAARSVAAFADPDTNEFYNVPIGTSNILGRLTISTVGIMRGAVPKVWPLLLNNGLGLTTLSNTITGNWTDSITLVDGSLTIVPEPSSVMLGLGALACLTAVAIRRRRAA